MDDVQRFTKKLVLGCEKLNMNLPGAAYQLPFSRLFKWLHYGAKLKNVHAF